jgi:hypothetical protein
MMRPRPDMAFAQPDDCDGRRDWLWLIFVLSLGFWLVIFLGAAAWLGWL